MKTILLLTSVAAVAEFTLPVNLPPLLSSFSTITGLPLKPYPDNPLLPACNENGIPPMDEQIETEITVPKCYKVKALLVNDHYPVTSHSVITASHIDNQLKGVLEGKGSIIIEAARRNGICPVFLSAVICHEAACGQSYLVRTKFNVAGIYRNGKYAAFESVDESIAYTAKLLGGKGYAKGKYTTLGLIQTKYCPVGADNDPKKLNKHWREGVKKYMIAIFGKEIYVKA